MKTAIEIVGALPSGAMPYPYDVNAKYDVIFFWPRRVADLESQFAHILEQIAPDGAIWAIIPKKKFAQAQGILFSWGAMQAAALTTDLVDNKTASITEIEYATRFVIRKDRRMGRNLAEG